MVWISEGERISVSDLERTIIDSLARPDLSGGVVEVATALQIGAERFDYQKLISYAERFDNQAVMKRLGFLLELLGLTTQSNIDDLQKQISSSYASLDPYLPKEGNYYSRWKLKINIEPDILEKAAST